MNVTGPRVYFRIPIFGGIPITETIVNMWIIMAVIVGVCIFLTRGLKDKPESKRQVVAELIVSKLYSLVESTMGTRNLKYAPLIGTLLSLSALGSLSSLVGMRPLTADLSVTLAWGIAVFIIIQTESIKTGGIVAYLKSFIDPVPVMLPLNIISTVATPVSMAFRHFGNIASGFVISKLVYMALAALSSLVLSFIPNDFIASIPIFQLGIPAVLSIYFDLFSGCLQAYIFCMLTMVYISNANET